VLLLVLCSVVFVLSVRRPICDLSSCADLYRRAGSRTAISIMREVGTDFDVYSAIIRDQWAVAGRLCAAMQYTEWAKSLSKATTTHPSYYIMLYTILYKLHLVVNDSLTPRNNRDIKNELPSLSKHDIKIENCNCHGQLPSFTKIDVRMLL